MQIDLLLNVGYAATVAWVEFKKEQKGKRIFSVSVQMKNGALMASALHLFLTQLKPKEKLLRHLDF